MKHFSRRGVLKVIGIVGLTSAAGRLLPFPLANAAMPQQDAAAMADFTTVSQRLTMHATLDETVSRALFHALNMTQQGFTQGLSQLKALLDAQPDLLNQPLLKFADGDAASEKLAKSILAGWYNGVVGKGNKAIYVTYINTLANKVVSGILVPPSFSYGPCGSWSKQP